jgi:hypothetical protein
MAGFSPVARHRKDGMHKYSLSERQKLLLFLLQKLGTVVCKNLKQHIQKEL